MKRILLFTFFISSLLLKAQTNIFDTYSDNPDVTYVNIKPKMFQMIAKIGIDTDDAEAKAYMDMVKSITSFKTMVTSNKTITADFSKWVGARALRLEELMEVKDNGARVNFYVKPGNDANHVKELLIFVNGADRLLDNTNSNIETVIVAMTGNIDLNQISKLTQKMNIPGGNHLGK